MIYHSEIGEFYFLLPLIGFFIGFFSAMLGGGGAFTLLPILILLYDTPAHAAVTTALAATIPICLFGSIAHYRKDHLKLHLTYGFILSGMIGAMLGAFLSSILSEYSLKIGFGCYAVLLSIFIVFRTQVREKKKLNFTNQNKRINTGLVSSFFGTFAGLINGALGANGAAVVVAGLFTLNLNIKIIVGTSIFIVLCNTVFAFGFHFIHGSIDLTLIYFLTAGTSIGALLGPLIISRISFEKSGPMIQYIIAIVMFIIGILMFIRA